MDYDYHCCYNRLMRILKALFGKHWWLPLVVIIVFIGLIIWAYTAKGTNSAAVWIFNALDECADIVAPAITLVLAIAAFWAIADMRLFQAKESKRSAFERIRAWAEWALKMLSVQSDTEFPSQQRDELLQKLRAIEADGWSAGVATRQFGGELESRVRKAIAGCITLTHSIEQSAILSSEHSTDRLKQDFREVIDTVSKLQP